MNNQSKTIQELIEENALLRQRINELEHSEAKHKLTVDTLYENEERYKAFFHNERVAIKIFDLETKRFVDVNDAHVRLYGYSREELLDNMTVLDILAEKSQFAIQSIKEGVTVFIPLQWHKKKDGTVFPVELVEGSYCWKGRRMMFSMALDITERKNAECALEKSENRYHSLFESSQDSIFIVNQSTGSFIDANPAACDLYGYTKDEFLQMKHSEISAEPEKSRTAVKNSMTRIPLRLHRKKDGTVFPVEITGGYYREGDCEIHTAFIHDLTRRNRRIHDLQISEKKHRSLFENMSQGVIYFTPSGEIISANPSAEAMLKLSSDEMSGHGFLNADWRLIRENGTGLPDEEHPLWRALYREEAVNQFIMGVQNLKKNINLWLSVSAIPLVHPDETKPYQVFTTFEDITEHKHAENALNRSREICRMLVEKSHDILFMLNTEGIFTYVSPGWTALLGHSIDSARGKWGGEFIHPEDIPRCQSFRDKVIKTGQRQSNIEHRMRHSDGSWLWLNANLEAIRDETGTVVGCQGISSDITKRRKASDTLKQMVKEQTSELASKNRLLIQEIKERKNVEATLRRKTKDVQRQAGKLLELNAALKVLLKHREEDKAELEEKVILNVKHLFIPNLENLKKRANDQESKIILERLESNLNDIISSFSLKLSSPYFSLTPTEIKVANFVKEGKSIKEVAKIMNVSHYTIDLHRFNLRKKLGIKSRKINLRTYLLSL